VKSDAKAENETPTRIYGAPAGSQTFIKVWSKF